VKDEAGKVPGEKTRERNGTKNRKLKKREITSGEKREE
jgi:hypothetical protein